ncbi:rhamnulokinase family protein [Myceligenerans crystallogenes]|uniref:Rhamnulokinase family protein n=1 Tax=Myceligenerans crystallogenes TaxID=316335 RepID=A0ABP4ZH91_9MICO
MSEAFDPAAGPGAAGPAGFVAVDLGATSGRVMLGIVSDGGDAPVGGVELVECGRFPNGPVASAGSGGDELRWDFEALWRGILGGLREAARVAAGRGVEVRGIGVDSWAVDHGLLDDDGRLIARPWCYRDGRNEPARTRVYERVPFAEHYAVTGLQDLPFTSVFQLVAGAADDDWRRVAQVLLIPDLVTYRLTGRRVAEVTNASTTGLVDARSRTWADPLIARLAAGFPELGDLRSRLPELVEPGAVVGRLLPEIREATGLGDVPVYAVASHDTASAVAAAPLAAEPGEPAPGAAPRAAAYVSSGTWSLVGLELDAPVLTDASRAANFTNELGVDGTVRYLRNVMGLWILNECVREWSEADVAAGGPAVDLGSLLDAAAGEPGGRCLLDVEGEEFLAPGDMAGRVRAAIAGPVDGAAGEAGDVPDTRPALVRVILDSLAAGCAQVIGRAAALAGVEVTAVHVVGGGSQNDLLNRLIAEATGLPVHAGPVEATALGNLLVQARAAGATSATIRDVVRASAALRTYAPAPAV